MRGRSKQQLSMLTISSLEDVVPEEHPLRRVKEIADAALEDLQVEFDAMYEDNRGRRSVPPERLLKSLLLMALYSVRSERMFCEQLGYNLLFKWFLDMAVDEAPFDHSTLSRNRERLLAHDAAAKFFRAVVEQARKRHLMSSEHFSVDGTLIEAWASMKSFRPKDEDDDDRGDGNGWADFKGEKRSNETHESKTDPESKLMRKGNGREAKLSFCMTGLMENRNKMLVGVQVARAFGYAERESSLELLDDELEGDRQITVGADRGFDTRDFVAQLRERNVTPHVAQNTSRRRSAIDARTTRHEGYRTSSIVRRQIEPVLGWLKNVAGLRKTRYRGVAKTNFFAQLAGAAFNLMKMSKLAAT